jgi:hypothetical protein
MANSNIDAFVTALQGYTGLDRSTLMTWATAENGYGNNVLGISKDPGGVLASGRQPNGFPTFATPQAGAFATYQFMLQNPGYTGILQSAGTSPQSQLAAIKASPWNTGKRNDPNSYAGNIAFTQGLGGTTPPTASTGSTPSGAGATLTGPGLTIAHLPVLGDVTIPGTATAGAAKLGIGLMLGILALVLFVIGTKAVLGRQSVTTAMKSVPQGAARAATVAAVA